MINISQFNETVLNENPEGIYVLRFEENTPFGKGYFNAVIYLDPDTEEPSIISEQEIENITTLDIVGWVDIKEINLATMTIIANSIKRRYDL